MQMVVHIIFVLATQWRAKNYFKLYVKETLTWKNKETSCDFIGKNIS